MNETEKRKKKESNALVDIVYKQKKKVEWSNTTMAQSRERQDGGRRKR